MNLDLLAIAAKAKKRREGSGVSGQVFVAEEIDGRTVAPGTTPKQASRIPEGMVFDPQTGGYVDAALLAERMGPGYGAAATTLAGAPFVGEFADEAMGRVDAFFRGRSPEVAQEIMRQSREQFAEDRSGLATALEIGGGVMGSLPIAAMGAGAIPAAASRLQASILGAGGGAVAGATEGGFQGYGRGETPDERMEEAFRVGRLGLVLGGVLGGAATPVSEAIRAGWSRMKVPDIKVIAQELGISDAAARSVRRALSQENPDEALRRIRQIGDEAMLADAGPVAAGVLDTAQQRGDVGLRLAREAVEGRSARQQSALTGVMDEILGEPQGVRATARRIAARTAPARREAYRAAYGTPINYADESGQAVEEAIALVPQGVLRQAIDDANEELLSNRELQRLGARQIMASIGDDGKIAFREMPSVLQLDELKKALDGIAQSNTDDFGKLNAKGIRYSRLAREIRDATVKATGGEEGAYAKAIALGGDKIAEDRALRLGSKLLDGRTEIEDVREWARLKPSEEARTAAAQGVREQLESIMGRVQATISDPNVDAREAISAVKRLSSRENRVKLTLLLGPEDAGKLLDEIERSSTALELRALTARNSSTFGRQATERAVMEEGQPGVLRQIIGEAGSPLEAARPLSQAIAGVDKQSMSEYHRTLFDEITRALTQIKGQDAERALAIVNRAMAGQPLKDQQADFVARIAVAPMFTGAYQTGTRYSITQ